MVYIYNMYKMNDMIILIIIEIIIKKIGIIIIIDLRLCIIAKTAEDLLALLAEVAGGLGFRFGCKPRQCREAV